MKFIVNNFFLSILSVLLYLPISIANLLGIAFPSIKYFKKYISEFSITAYSDCVTIKNFVIHKIKMICLHTVYPRFKKKNSDKYFITKYTQFLKPSISQ